MSRPGVSLALALALCACLPVGARAGQAAKLNANFIPEHLGAATTVSFGFQITTGARTPAALSAVHFAYPADLGLATSGLGLASCSPSELEAVGVGACPPDSRMGSGSAAVEIPFDPEVVKEGVEVTLFAGPSPDGYLHVLAYVNGVFPVYAQLVLSGVLLHGNLSIVVPPIPSLPEAPDVVVTQMQLTLGGDLTYYEQVDGRRVAYHPAGVGLPSRCPRGGFPFAATFAFVDGSELSARTAVPCPHAR